MRRVLIYLAAMVLTISVVGSAGARQGDEQLDGLFARLKATADSQEAAVIQARIWEVWFESGAADIDRLLAAGNVAMNGRNFEAALARFDAVIARAPELAEGWNRRATLYYLMGEFEASITDIQHTLALEPRHFGALSGLGLVNIRLGQLREAIAAFEAALAVNPHMESARQNIREINKVLGEDI